jgi:hypothetical protein
MTEAGGELVVEEGKRFSESVLFRVSRRFYEAQGTRLWDEGVLPSWMTNNPRMVDAYGQVVLAYVRDASAAANGGIDPAQPVYIVELAAGHGAFGFLFLKWLTAMKGCSTLRGLDLRYVLTDFSESTVNAWESNPRLRPFVEAGVLELGIFDVTRDREIRLLSGRARSRETV